MPDQRASFAIRLSVFLALACLIGVGWVLTSTTSQHAPKPTDDSAPREPESLNADGIENLWRLPLSNGGVLYSGGQPHGAVGFASLEKLGVKTVISVDGAPPDVELAKQHGLRYIHLPIGYSDVPAERLTTMIAAVKSLPGPVFVHCHHGKHRGPAAAVCVWRALRGDITPDAAVNLMKEMGTAEKYRGLYRAAGRESPGLQDIQHRGLKFPEVTPVAPLAEQMVGIDHAWEQIRELLKAETPAAADRAALDELWTDGAERFREAARPTDDAELRQALEEAAELWASATSVADAERWQHQQLLTKRVEQQCQQCHARHRDGN